MERRTLKRYHIKNFKLISIADAIYNMTIEGQKKAIYNLFINDYSGNTNYEILKRMADDAITEPSWINAKTTLELTKTSIYKNIRNGFIIRLLNEDGEFINDIFFKSRREIAKRILVSERKKFEIEGYSAHTVITKDVDAILKDITKAIDNGLRTRDDIIGYAYNEFVKRKGNATPSEQPLPFIEEEQKVLHVEGNIAEEFTKLNTDYIEFGWKLIEQGISFSAGFIEGKEYNEALKSTEMIRDLLDTIISKINNIIKINTEKGN